MGSSGIESTMEPQWISGERVVTSFPFLKDARLSSIRGWREWTEEETLECLIWVTNFRLFIRTQDEDNSRELSIPHARTLRLIEVHKQRVSLWQFLCRGPRLYSISLQRTGLSKEALRLIQQLVTPHRKKKLFCFSHPASTYESYGWNVFDVHEELIRQGVDTHDRTNQNALPSVRDLSATSVHDEDGCEDINNIQRIHISWSRPRAGLLLRQAQPELATDPLVSEEGEELLVVNIMRWHGPDEHQRPLYWPHNSFALHPAAHLWYIQHHRLESIILRTPRTIRRVVSSWVEGQVINCDQTPVLEQMSTLLTGALLVAQQVQEGHIVLACGTSGRGQLSTLCALAQLFLDPFYRTIRGFCILIEKEFIYYRHRFTEYTLHLHLRELMGQQFPLRDPHAVVFALFIECVLQIMRQRPECFSFTPALPQFVLDSVYSCQFGTFLPNGTGERHRLRQNHPNLPSVWSYVMDHALHFAHAHYDPDASLDHVQTHVGDLAPLF